MPLQPCLMFLPQRRGNELEVVRHASPSSRRGFEVDFRIEPVRARSDTVVLSQRIPFRLDPCATANACIVGIWWHGSLNRGVRRRASLWKLQLQKE